MEQAQQVATQETAPVAAALPTPSQGKKSCKTFKKVENLPANRGPRKPCKSLVKEEEEVLEEEEGEEVLQEKEEGQEGEEVKEEVRFQEEEGSKEKNEEGVLNNNKK